VEVFEDDRLVLNVDAKNLNFLISTQGHDPVGFNDLPDGYKALLNIVIELLLRMEIYANSTHDMPGIVLIDEIEAHLHVSLQKKVLPMLTAMFPNIQFIVSTHSPFVISSLENAVVYDLEHLERVEDLSAYSYSILAETWFDVDEYSEPLKERIARLETLLAKKRNKEEDVQLEKDIHYLISLPAGSIDDELALKLQSFKFQHRELFKELSV
jgi:predicted ATP-binding protein involved in virulence